MKNKLQKYREKKNDLLFFLLPPIRIPFNFSIYDTAKAKAGPVQEATIAPPYS